LGRRVRPGVVKLKIYWMICCLKIRDVGVVDHVQAMVAPGGSGLKA